MNQPWMAIAACVLLVGCGAESPSPSATASHAPPADSAGVSERKLAAAERHDAGTYAQRRGGLLFGHYCAVCHGEGGMGDGFNAYSLAPVRLRDLSDPAFTRTFSDRLLAEVIREGGRGTRRSVLMPAWGNTLAPGQIEDLVAFIGALAVDSGQGGTRPLE